ncbi:hypothetical protein EV426DRAFT_608096 [Tirmania nivea]|nr:hypothetical protein EV426DRAFT_608096 [Tirmania nivea]
MMYNPLSILRMLTVFLLIHHEPFAKCQQKPTDVIDFRQAPGWLDYRECVQTCFYYCLSGVCSNQVADELGCKTNKCLCSEKTIFELGLASTAKCAEECNTVEDTNAAKKLFTEYCALKGYNPPWNNDDGDSSITTPTENSPFSYYTALQIPSLSPTSPVSSNTKVGPSQATSQSTSTFTESPTQIPQATATDEIEDTNTSTDSKKSEFGTSEIIGTIVGIAGLFVAILTLYITWKKRKEKQQLRSLGV